MEPIFDRRGAVVGWFDGAFVVGPSNTFVGHVKADVVLSMSSGRPLGYFAKGFFRDHRGDAVAFLRGATGGPITPIVSSFTPMAPVLPVRPMTPIGIAPIVLTPVGSLAWGEEWAEFLAG